MDRDGWLRVTAVARLFGVSRSKVLLLINGGQLKAVRHTPRGMFLVRESEAQAYLDALESETALAA